MKELKWIGPYSFLPIGDAASVLESESSHVSGVYLWTIMKDERYLINYVGKSKDSIRSRHYGHIRHFFDGESYVYDSNKFTNGLMETIHNPNQGLRHYFENYEHLSKNVYEILRSYSVFFAPIDSDNETIERIESALIRCLRKDEGANFLDNKRTRSEPSEDDLFQVRISDFDKFIGMKSVIDA